MVKRNARRARTRRPRRTRGVRRGRTRRTVRAPKPRRRLQGKELARTAVAVATGLQSAYETGKTLYDAYTRDPTAVGKRTKKGGSRTRTVTTRKRDDDGTGPYQQWSQRYAQASFGRMKLSKLINKENLTLYHQRFTRFNQGRGAEWLAQTTDTTNNVRTLPCVWWDLTACINHVGGSISKPGCMYQLSKSIAAGTDGNIAWRPVNGLTLDGTTSTNTWEVEKSEHGASNNDSYPGASSVLQWAAIELELWGQQQYHTKWTVELCQFNEDVHPDPAVAVANTGGPYEMYWDSMIKSYAYSPLYSGSINGFKGKKRKVLRRYNLDIDPTSTTETNADPHCRTFKLFFRFNRRCNYDWQKSGGNGQTITEFDDIDAPSEIASNQVTVHPNARIYLMLRATDYNPKASFAAQSVSNTPSYSWKIRTRHMLVN